MQVSRNLLLRIAPGLLLLASLVYFGLGVMGNKSMSATAEPQYVDHLRHQRYAWELLDSRFDIPRLYRTPMKDLPRPVSWDGYIWIESSYAYPFGALLFFTPFALLSYNFQPLASLIAKLLVFLLILIAHFDTYIYYKVILEEKDKIGARILRLATVVIFYLILVMWSINGQYEAVPLLFALLAGWAYQRHKIRLAIAFLAAAFFVKYQALVLLPLLVLLFREVTVADRRIWLAGVGQFLRKLPATPALFAIVVLGVDAFTVLLSLPFMPQKPGLSGTPISILHLVPPDGMAVRVLALWVLTLAVGAYLLFKREYLFAASVLFLLAALSVQNIVQGWYVVWLFVPALFARRGVRDLLSFWALGFLYVIAWVPDYVYVFNLVWPYVTGLLAAL